MSRTTDSLDPTIAAYVRAAAMARESETLARLREVTADLPMARMQISVEQGRLMALVAKMLGVRRALEVGVFTGHIVAVAIAVGVGPLCGFVGEDIGLVSVGVIAITIIISICTA